MELTKPATKSWITILITVGAILLSVILSYLPVFEALELKLLDFSFGIRGPLSVEDSPIVIIAIDDQSDASTPDRWPWPRYYYAHLVENLMEAGAKVVGIDVIFDQKDAYNPQSDSLLADVLSRYDNVVLVGKIEQLTDNRETFLPPDSMFQVNSKWGLAGVTADVDGFYRRYLIGGQIYRDSLFDSFAGQVLKLYSGNDSVPTGVEGDYFTLGDYIIPKYDASSMLVNIHGPARTFTYYSFDQVLDDEDFDLRFEYDMDIFDDPGEPELGIPAGLKYSGELKDKIILIGSTMQELHDNFPTPFLEHSAENGESIREEMPGVEIHANAIQTILSRNYLQKIPTLFSYLLLLVFGILVYLITRWLHTGWGAAITLFFMAAYILTGLYLFTAENLILSYTAPSLVILLTFIGHTLYHYLLTQQEKKMIRGAFARYLPEKVVQQLIGNPDMLRLGGDEQIVTVLFSDVAGFTSISEQVTPRELVALLNEYLTAMTDIVLEHNGIIDKYEGDAIMAEFGVPVNYDDHAQMGCRAALKMQHVLGEMRQKWLSEGKPDIQARVGLNTGEVIVGNMGSRDVFDYTVMGDHVNLGSRLEGANKAYGTKIMISEFTNGYVKNEFYTRPLDLIRVKGKQKPVEVFELIGEKTTPLSAKQNEHLEYYIAGMQSYRNREWEKGIDYFEHCLELFPDDQPSQIYRTRCIEFRYNEPPEDWDGVITMKTK